MRTPSKRKPFSTIEKSLFLIPALIIAGFYVWQALPSNPLLPALTKPDRELRGGTGRVSGLLFSPNGKRLISRRKVKQQRGYLELWDVENSKLLQTLPYASGSIPFAAFSPDGSVLEIREGAAAYTSWDAETGEAKNKPPQVRPSFIKLDNGIGVSDISVYGTQAVSQNRKVVELRDLHSDKLKFRLYHPQREEPFFKMTPDGKSILTYSDPVSSSGDKPDSLTFWNAETGKEKTSIVIPGISFPSFLNDKIAIVPNHKKVILLNWHNGEIVDSLETPSGLWSIEKSPDDKTLAATVYGPENHNPFFMQVFLWDVQTKKKSGPLSLPLSSYKNYTSLNVNAYWSGFSSDSKTFFIGKKTGLVRFYHARNGKQHHSIKLQGVRFEENHGYYQLSPDKKLLAGSGMVVNRLQENSTSVFYLWDAQDGRLLKSVFTEASAFVTDYFSPDGKWLAAPQEDGSIQLWDLAKLKKDEA